MSTQTLAPIADKNDTYSVAAVTNGQHGAADPFADIASDMLISKHVEISEYVEKQETFDKDRLKPWKEKLALIETVLLERINIASQQAIALGKKEVNSIKSDVATAYKATYTNYKIENSTAFLTYCVENYRTFGQSLLDVGAAKKPMEKYLEDFRGALPPGVTASAFSRINVRSK